MTHTLPITETEFKRYETGYKHLLLIKEDRPYQVDDLVIFQEKTKATNAPTEMFTGREYTMFISFVDSSQDQKGLKQGWVLLSLILKP